MRAPTTKSSRSQEHHLPEEVILSFSGLLSICWIIEGRTRNHSSKNSRITTEKQKNYSQCDDSLFVNTTATTCPRSGSCANINFEAESKIKTATYRNILSHFQTLEAQLSNFTAQNQKIKEYLNQHLDNEPEETELELQDLSYNSGTGRWQQLGRSKW